MNCPNCDQEYGSQDRYCGKCGFQIAFDCPVCQGLHPIGSIYCSRKGVDIVNWVAAKEAKDKDYKIITEVRERVFKQKYEKPGFLKALIPGFISAIIMFLLLFSLIHSRSHDTGSAEQIIVSSLFGILMGFCIWLMTALVLIVVIGRSKFDNIYLPPSIKGPITPAMRKILTDFPDYVPAQPS